MPTIRYHLQWEDVTVVLWITNRNTITNVVGYVVMRVRGSI